MAIHAFPAFDDDLVDTTRIAPYIVSTRSSVGCTMVFDGIRPLSPTGVMALSKVIR